MSCYTDGKLCISILHPPGDDPTSGERAEERWNPTQSVESILLSVVSLLNDPNVSSPANVDAGVMWRNDKKAYAARIKEEVEKSKADIPADLVMPTSAHDFLVKQKEPEKEDESFWLEHDDDGMDDDEDEEDEEEEDEEMEDD
ncbi:hypothetical protein HK101_007640 [Irineochytrium annulatum]|nr:hypothetical protein HK101_007640 [Irineochytrium annulatum]